MKIRCTKGALSSILGHPTCRTAATFADKMMQPISLGRISVTPKKLVVLPLCNHTLSTRWTLLLGLVHNLDSLCSSHAIVAAYLPGRKLRFTQQSFSKSWCQKGLQAITSFHKATTNATQTDLKTVVL